MPRSPRLAHKAPDLQARAASLVSVSSVVAAAAVSSTYPVATAEAAAVVVFVVILVLSFFLKILGKCLRVLVLVMLFLI